MIGIEYGILKELNVRDKFGVRAAVVNVVIREHGKEPVDDAALLIMRRSFDVGRMHIILRQNMHAVLDTQELIQMAHDATVKLFGSADKDNLHRMADLLLDHTDELVLHPPEDQMRLWKKEQKILEQSQALIRVNDKVILDAR